MRLRQLARLEGIKIEQELAGKREEQVRLQELLDNPASLKRLLVKEIEADAKQYGDDRRTLIETAERAVLETKVLDEPVTVIVSQKGWLRARQGHGHDASQFGFKQGDDLYGAFECRTTDTLIAVGDNGRVYSVAVSGLPSARGDGQPITTMIDLESGSRIVHMIAAAADSRWLLATRGGYGFAAKLSDMFSRQRAGKQFITLEAGDELLRPVPLFDGATQLALLSDKGKFLVFGLDEVKSLSGGGRGTILMGLDTADKLDQAVPIGAAGLRRGRVPQQAHRGHPGRLGAHALRGQARAQGPAAGRAPEAAGAVAGVGLSVRARSGNTPIPRHAGAGFFWEASWRSRSGRLRPLRGRGRRDPFVDEAARLGFN